MFDRRQDLVKFLAVAEAGGILAAAERLAITQPALSRLVARLEKRLGGRLFERQPSGVRLTPLGTVAVELARGLLREIETAEEKIEAAVSGRAGRFRITATPVWMQAVVAPALARYREALPGVERALRTAPFAEGLRLLENGESDLHCGGADPGRPLPAFPSPACGTFARFAADGTTEAMTEAAAMRARSSPTTEASAAHSSSERPDPAIADAQAANITAIRSCMSRTRGPASSPSSISARTSRTASSSSRCSSAASVSSGPASSSEASRSTSSTR